MIVFLVVPPVALAPSVQQEAMTVPSPTPLSTEATQHNQTHNQTSEPCVQETQPYDDCGCCKRTQAAMEKYCEEQKPMGDLDLVEFDCQSLGADLTVTSTETGVSYSDYHSCIRYCDDALAQVRKEECGIKCDKLITCHCAPPPPPPCVKEAEERFDHCVGVTSVCCEAMLDTLTKFCYSFEPQGTTKKGRNASHWDGGAYEIPPSFYNLCAAYAPHQCDNCRESCELMLQYVARETKATGSLCDAIAECPRLQCEPQCPSPAEEQNHTMVPDTIIGGKHLA